MKQKTLFNDACQARPTGKLGQVLERLLLTGKDWPITPLDLASKPEMYGTDCMRQLRFARKWVEEHTDMRVHTERVKGKTFFKYWVE